MNRDTGRRAFVWGAAVAMILAGLYTRWPGFYMDTKYRDIYFVWNEGEQIARGVNPYERVRGSDMVNNDKYPTYLPPMYLFGAAARLAGFRTFESFLMFWRFLILMADIAVGLIILRYALKKGRGDIGLFTLFFWLFCRWSLYVWEIGNTEAILALLMIGAVMTWDRRPVIGALLFGMALGIKHFGILLLPVLLARSRDPKEMMKRLGWVLAIPVLTSLPFFITSPVGFTKAMLFSVVRGAGTHLLEDARSIRILFGASGWISRLFLFGVFCLYWTAAIRGRWNLWLAAATAFTVFISFNPVLFTQYFGWITPFGLLYLCDVSASPPEQAPPKAVRSAGDIG